MCNNYDWYEGIKGDYVIPSMKLLKREIYEAREALRKERAVSVDPATYINMISCMAFELHKYREE